MDPPPPPPLQPSVSASSDEVGDAPSQRTKSRSDSMSQRSDDSQTAADFIRDQMQLEADAREAMPYSIETCTKSLGPLRQSVYACLTCNPPPADLNAPYQAAGVCYACSVQCHGEHTLVEIFTKRNFTCDCGTTRLPATSPCSLRLNPETNAKGGVHSEEPAPGNKYNQNFRNRFCGCSLDYDPFEQKGTMFQCLGLGTHEEGGCGEDWYHPGCLVGLGPRWYEKMGKDGVKAEEKNSNGNGNGNGVLATISEDAEAPAAENEQDGDAMDVEDDDPPPPPGFPEDDEFEGYICYKCVEAFPWIRRYAGAPGFLPPVFYKKDAPTEVSNTTSNGAEETKDGTPASNGEQTSKKRKASDDDDEGADETNTKRQKSEEDTTSSAPVNVAAELVTGTEAKPDGISLCRLPALPPAPQGRFSLFLKENFREKICHCSSCFPLLKPHPQLLEEEETYEPPVSDDGGSENGGGSTHGSGSLLERGESALRNIDRVRAIEGVMAYNHLKDKLKPFFQEFAESGRAISADDIKDYFAKLRGDQEAIREAGEAAKTDNRKEQSGY